MDVIGPRQIELKLHGLSPTDHGQVPAKLFAAKLTQFVAALEAADRVENGHAAHSYVLANMHMSEPTAVLAEVERDAWQQTRSALPTFNEAVDSIKVHDARVGRLSPVINKIERLASGVEKRFRFAEVRTGNAVVRIDDFLRKRSTAIRKAKGAYYDGASYGSFDGVLDYVDLRGQLPQIKLTLTAGRVDIDCTCNRSDIDALGDVLHSRVRVYGRAIYASTNPLPLRVEVSSIERVKIGGDLERWRGAFRPFAIDGWSGDA